VDDRHANAPTTISEKVLQEKRESFDNYGGKLPATADAQLTHVLQIVENADHQNTRSEQNLAAPDRSLTTRDQPRNVS